IDDDVKEDVRIYNADDCRSAFGLRQWLEKLRAESVAAGVSIDRPGAGSPEAPESVQERIARVRPVQQQLLEGIPENAQSRSPVEHARWLLAHLLEWHRRE